MNRYIFGFDSAHPVACAQELRRKGVGAVVVGDADEATASALAREGVALYLCYGAHSLGGRKDAMARKVTGEEQLWFSSGCPNDAALAEKRLNAALERAARIPTARGILVDGARFASFASTEGREAFFTCFCPRCMEKMGGRAGAIRDAALRLWRTRRVCDVDVPALKEWFDFRERCVQEFFDRFAARVHALRAEMTAGAFVFAPSLTRFVGQTSAACRSLDVVAPMLYRAYPHEDGPACLGHEWAALAGLFGDQAADFAALAGLPDALRLDASASPDALLQSGFEPQRVGVEVAFSRSQLRPGQQLWPIVQIEDTRIAETVRLAQDGGADAVGYFAFGQADVPAL